MGEGDKDKQLDEAVILKFSDAVEKKEALEKEGIEIVNKVRDHVLEITDNIKRLKVEANVKIAQGKIEEALICLEELSSMGNYYGFIMARTLNGLDGFKNYMYEFKKLCLIYEDSKSIPEYLTINNSTLEVLKDLLEYGNGNVFCVTNDSKNYRNIEEGMTHVSREFDQLHLKTDVLARLHLTFKNKL